MHWAYCGYDCEGCPVYGAPDGAEVRCPGCRSSAAPPCAMCEGCQIRACAGARGLEHCWQCGDYPCQQLQAALPEGCESRKRLDAWRSGLGSE